MNKIKPRTPSGFPEYLPDEQIEFNRLMSIIRNTYELYGFSPIDTPDLELSDILLTKSGGETEQQVYRFTKGSNDLTMRFDLTVPLARYTAQHEGELVFPFRRYHIGKVHRGERAQAGRFREFYQCDIDVIGSDNVAIDAEMPAVINDIFEKFNFGEFTIRINNRLVLNGFFEGIGINDNISKNVLRIIDKIEKISREDFLGELKKEALDESQIAKIIEFTNITGSNHEIINKLEDLGVESDNFQLGVNKLRQLIDLMTKMGIPENRFKVDLKIARGLDYYTGTVYETFLNDYPEIGSVCSGGRYDDLASHYTNSKLPGVGISIGLSRLFYKLRELDIVKPKAISPAKIVVIPLDNNQFNYAIKATDLIRKNHKSVILYSETGAIKKKMRYADRMGFDFAILIGEDEVKNNSVSIKNMHSSESATVSFSKLADFVNHI